jgi:hypothetical protein
MNRSMSTGFKLQLRHAPTERLVKPRDILMLSSADDQIVRRRAAPFGCSRPSSTAVITCVIPKFHLPDLW